MLARAVGVWPDVPPDALVAALVRSIRAGAISHAEKGRVPAFGARFEAGPFYVPIERPIAFDLGDAIAALASDARESVLAAILECDEPLTLAQLLTVAPPATHERLKQRIAQLTPQEAGTVMTLLEVQARVEALLSAGLNDVAATFMKEEEDVKTLGQVPGRALVRFRAQLRWYLQRGDLAAIDGATLPANLPPAEEPEGTDALDFYRALAHLYRRPPNPDEAKRTFERLHQRRPDVAAYVVNMLAAETSAVLAGDLFRILRGAEVKRARSAVNVAGVAIARCRATSDEDRVIHECNRALLWLATGAPERAHQGLISLPAGNQEERVVAYDAVALFRMGRRTEGQAAIGRAVIAFGETDLLEAARAQIQGGTPFDARPAASSVEDPLPGLKAAVGEILLLDPHRQSAVLRPPPDPLFDLITEYVGLSAASVVALVPMMKNVEIDSCEDDLSAFVQAMLRARFGFLGWSVTDQSRGGFTAAGNPGERDIVIMKDSAVLAVLEAVVCNRPASHAWTRDELTSHFHKLFAYGQCSLFFHLTYSYEANPADVLAELQRIAASETPPGFQYLDRGDLRLTDSGVLGFVAKYQGNLAQVKVVFLLLDLKQKVQRDAAALAATSNPRKKATTS
jgi:hypothetical protein